MTKQKQICIVAVLVTFILGGGLFKYSNQIKAGNLFSFANKQSITANAQTTTPFVTIAVEQYTQNHLPNITGTCSIGNDMVFTIKKGSTGVVSETINKACTVSPYALTPTILLPDGKYRVDVSVTVAACVVNTINGTSDDETLIGTPGCDIIYGNGGNDTMIGGGGNDTLIGGSGGNDTIVSNVLNGTDDTLLGVGEQDVLVGGAGSFNTFVLGNSTSSFYVGQGNADYVSIVNFNADYDTIQLFGVAANYNLVQPVGGTGIGIASLYRIDTLGNQDLIAKITTSSAIDLNINFVYTP
jgi:Ca2+-binding RTX toxin-like protein